MATPDDRTLTDADDVIEPLVYALKGALLALHLRDSVCFDEMRKALRALELGEAWVKSREPSGF